MKGRIYIFLDTSRDVKKKDKKIKSISDIWAHTEILYLCQWWMGRDKVKKTDEVFVFDKKEKSPVI